MSSRKRQVFSIVKRFHSRVRYMGGKEKLSKCQGGNRRLWKGILMQYGGYEKTRKRKRSICQCQEWLQKGNLL